MILYWIERAACYVFTNNGLIRNRPLLLLATLSPSDYFGAREYIELERDCTGCSIIRAILDYDPS